MIPDLQTGGSYQQQPVTPTTTLQEDLTTAGQRRINVIWEVTQALVAVLVVAANMTVAVYDGIYANNVQFPAVLSNALFLIVGFYFSRTNHTAIGGIGIQPQQPYQGR